MNKEQYNNIIKTSLDNNILRRESNLETVRTVFNNMGVALPQGDFSKVSETLATNDYMYWKSCTREEAQEYANQGIPAIRVDETNIQLIFAGETDDSINEIANTSSLLLNNNDFAIEELESISKEPTYYAYSNGATNDSSPIIANGTYYLNNGATGKYVQKQSWTVDGEKGLLENLGDSIKWRIEKLGSYYVIRYAADPKKYLGVEGEDLDSAIVATYTINSSTVPNYCKWSLAHGLSIYGGLLFRNLFNSRYLSCVTALHTRKTIGQPTSTAYVLSSWRILSTDKYGNSSNYEQRELNSFSISCNVNVNESAYLKINKSPSNAVWAAPKDFIYEVLDGAEHITIENETGLVTGLSIGATRIKATHRVTGITYTFTIYVDRYVHELVNTFKFAENVAFLIRDLYEKVNTYFSDESTLKKAWMCARLLGGIVYGNESSTLFSQFKWKDVAGKVFSGSEQTYFTTELEYSESEYENLRNAIVSQHNNSSTPDFAHMQMSMSARLAYELDKDGIVSNLGTFCSDEVISYLAGWLGDATVVTDSDNINMKNDDYCADLDAENIYRIIANGTSAIEAHNEYYASLNSRTTRATIFLSHIPYNYVESKVMSRLGIIGNDSYTILSNYYPDTYNFIMSLQDELQNMDQY